MRDHVIYENMNMRCKDPKTAMGYILANRAPKLSAHYSSPLEPHQISAEEVPDFVSAHLSRPATLPLDHSNRGRP